MVVKKWFENKITAEYGGGFIEDIIGVKRETEKAYLMIIEIGYSSSLSRKVEHWVPKSCVMTDEEAAEENRKEVERLENGLAYNERLVAFAKENLVKGVRKGMRTVTLIRKIQEAGLTVPARA